MHPPPPLFHGVIGFYPFVLDKVAIGSNEIVVETTGGRVCNEEIGMRIRKAKDRLRFWS